MDSVVAVEGSLQRSLSSRQQWILSSRRATFATAVAVAGEEQDPGAIEVVDPRPDQEEQVTNNQKRAQLQEALMALPAGDRLVLQLRYEQDLSLDEIARLCELGDAQRVHRRLAAILKGLRRALR